MITLKNEREIEKITACCQLVGRLLNQIDDMIRPGLTTAEIDHFVEESIRAEGAKPAFKGYKGFPKSICASVNDVIVHGIPNSTQLSEGDIVSIDIGIFKDGFYGDAARTYPVGTIDAASQKLLKVTQAALAKAIETAQVGHYVQDISATVQNYVESQGFSVVRDFVGHGIGRSLHEDPPVPNFGKAGMGPKLAAGLVLAIEPMVNQGKCEVKIDADGWTARTADGKRSAHFEHCIVVTAKGPKILSEVD